MRQNKDVEETCSRLRQPTRCDEFNEVSQLMKSGSELPHRSYANCVVACLFECLIRYITRSQMAQIPETLVNEINHAIGEALMLSPGEETSVLATVVSGYTELVSLSPENHRYAERLASGLFKLAEFFVERGQQNLGRRFVLLRDEVLRSCRRAS